MTSSTTRSTPGSEALLEAAIAFMLGIHGEAFAAKKFAEQGGEFRIVIDQQNVHGLNLPCRCAARRCGVNCP